MAGKEKKSGKLGRKAAEAPAKARKDDAAPPPQQEKPPTPTTVERPRQTCGCEASNLYFFRIGSAPGQRVALTVSSKVECDATTPDHCNYEYTASAVLERRQGARWVQDGGNRKAFITKFKVGAPVDITETPDRVDQSSLTIAAWYAKAPQKDEVEVELTLVASVRGGWKHETKRKATLCLPKLDNPVCPEKP